MAQGSSVGTKSFIRLARIFEYVTREFLGGITINPARLNQFFELVAEVLHTFGCALAHCAGQYLRSQIGSFDQFPVVRIASKNFKCGDASVAVLFFDQSLGNNTT